MDMMSTKDKKAEVNSRLVDLVYPFTNSRGSREFMHSVCIQPHPAGGVTLLGTDGDNLLVAYDFLGSVNCEHMAVQLEKETLGYLNNGDILTIEGGNATVRNLDSVNIITQSAKIIDTPVIKWQALFKEKKITSSFDYLDPRSIRKFEAVTKKLSNRHGSAYIGLRKLEPIDGKGSSCFYVNFFNSKGLIELIIGCFMPVRGPEKLVEKYPYFIEQLLG